MNLVDIAQKNGRTYKRVSNIHGGEYHGPCPGCGGNDRFHIWPDQGEHGTFWCRGCDLGGDAIEYLMKFEGMAFPAACKEVGKPLPEQEEYQAPQFKRPAANSFTPRETVAPADLWVQHATKLADWAHEQLLNNPDQLAYLAGRGITLDAVKQFRLGYNPGEKGKDLYRAREAWGLESVVKDGKTKKLWLPIGLVIPFYADGIIRRLRIRIPNDRRTEQFSLPYYLVPGSSMDSFITRPDAKAWFITEAELDAIAIHAQAGDLTGAIAMGNSTAKPTAAAYQLLENSLWIGNALDYDAKIEEGKYENAGGVGWVWWKKHFAQAVRWPVPVGKDPGDAFKQGISLRDWVTAGLPPVLTLPATPVRTCAAPRPVVEDSAPQQDNSGAGSPAVSPEEGESALVQSITAQDGRIIYITDNQAEYQRLTAAGKIVFDSNEVALVKQSGADQEQAASFLNFKQVFPGIRLTEVGPYQQPTDTTRPEYRGKYYPAR